MNKVIAVLIIAVLAVVIFVAFNTLQQGEVVPTLTEEEAQIIAKDWIENNAPTYLYDGSDLKVFSVIQPTEEEYEVIVDFTSSSAGYGDRSDSMNAQVITHHQTAVIIRNGEVFSVVTDEYFDEMNQAFFDSASDEEDYLEINLYFVKTIANEDGSKTEEVAPASRKVMFINSLPLTIVSNLLEGPNEEETASGFTTAIPEGVELIDVSMDNEIITVDFTQKLQEGVAGSAWVTTIREQIEKTLLEVEGVTSIVIQVEGDEEEVLQP